MRGVHRPRPIPHVVLLAASLLVPAFLVGCGSDMRDVMAGSYVLGNPHAATFKARYFQARARGSFMVGDTYVTSELIGPVLESTDAVLRLSRDGRFSYAGPPRPGKDPVELVGTWVFEDDAIQLNVKSASPRDERAGTTIVCAYRPAMISYPADPDAEAPVYFDLALDRELEKVPLGAGGVRVDTGG